VAKVTYLSRVREKKVLRGGPKPLRRRRWRTGTWVGFVALGLMRASALAMATGPQLIRCNIKGNISYRTGEHIYHSPQQLYYYLTQIDPARGERWFCSENEARQAGWRKARI
jgi:hypothetical protein